MLSFLHIENIAVIKKLDLDFKEGFTALTGETGAGKSIIIDSICLLMGARSSRELIRSGEDFARVSAVFTELSDEVTKELEKLDIIPDEDGTVSIMRTIYADGRAQARINMQSVQVGLLKEASKHLIGIQSQHESHILLDSSNHINYLDQYAILQNKEHKQLLSAYSLAFSRYKSIFIKLKELREAGFEKEHMRELYEYQIKDIAALSLKEGEEEALEARYNKLANAEKLQKGSEFVYRALSSNNGGLCAADLLEKSVNALKKLAAYIPEAAELAEKLIEYKYEIIDIGERARDFVPGDVGNVALELDKIASRLDAISKLKKKYGSSVAGILEFKREKEKKLDELENNEELIEKAEKEAETLEKALISAANVLHESRIKAAKMLEDGIASELAFLDMRGARFKIRVDVCDNVEKYTLASADNVEFLIAANPGEELKSMSKTASGGELSRVMLALKSKLVGADQTGTVIFDEIDTGVSGKTSEKIGLRLKKISRDSQVFCITHSAQVAALSDTHMYISKSENNGRNETFVKILDFEERVMETARITSGTRVSEKQLEAARDMLISAKNAEIRLK